MDIQLQHQVPKQHKIEKTPGVRGLSSLEVKKFEQYHKLVTGKFSPEEDRIIHENWNNFCKVINRRFFFYFST